MALAASPEAKLPRAEVLVATTWRCNLRCSYCFVQECDLARGGARMSPQLAARVLDALDQGLSDVESVCVHLYGGEPLTNLPALRAMVERAEEKTPGRFSFAITTNGTCGSEAAVALLGRGRFQVILSVDGPAAVHDECRRTAGGGATHARVLEFLGQLRARTECRVRGSSVVRSGWSLARAESYLRTLPVDAIKAQAVRGPEGTPYALSAAEKAAYLDDLEELGRQVVAELEADRVPLDDRFSNRVLQLLAGFERESFCGAGESTFGVTPTGEVLPCVLMEAEGHRLGHVDGDPAVWRQAGERWRQRRQAPRPECRGCPALPLCGGGCPALLPVCGADECDYVRRCCQVAAGIYRHFRARPEKLLTLAGIH
jgi:uncharacterized protein